MKHPFEDYSLLGLHAIDSLLYDVVEQHVDTLSFNEIDIVDSTLCPIDSCSLGIDDT